MPDGAIIYYVTLTDPAGNVGAGTIASATLDRVPPSGYSIKADQSTLDSSTAASAGFTFEGAEVDATFNYSISSDGGGTPVTGSGTITLAAQDVTGINVSSLLNGTLTFSVTLTDPSGNLGLPPLRQHSSNNNHAKCNCRIFLFLLFCLLFRIQTLQSWINAQYR